MLAAALALPITSSAGVVFRPKNQAVMAPGEEEMNGNAQELFQIAQTAENSGDLSRAIKAYRTIVRKYPKDALAPGAAYRFAFSLRKKIAIT